MSAGVMAKPFMFSWEVEGCEFYNPHQPRVSHKSFCTNLSFLEDYTLMSTSSCYATLPGPVRGCSRGALVHRFDKMAFC